VKIHTETAPHANGARPVDELWSSFVNSFVLSLSDSPHFSHEGIVKAFLFSIKR